MKMHVLPPKEYLHDCFEYLEDGRLMNKIQPRSHFPTERGYNISKTRNRERKEVGQINLTNYRVVKITYLGKNTEFLVHRLIWVMHYGVIPEGYFVDHEDTNRLNNRIGNLRLALQPQNRQNSNFQSNNTSGFKGVFWHKTLKLWQVRVGKDGFQHHIGYYKTIEEANAAAIEARARMHGEFVNHGTSC
jgi:hypothetical protein